MLPLTLEELKPYQDTKVCYICRKKIFKKSAEDENYRKVRDIFIKQVNIEVQHIVFVILNLTCRMKSV